jgi:peptidoglycan/LPS O-acetylase OafA/YrhL
VNVSGDMNRVPSQGFRADVQGLRALAVSMVVIYHLYPSLLPGGFAGVDVFFVISGFLITSHLWREYRTTGQLSLVDFWGRRAKRLMPAAALVLAVTWVASLLLLPSTQIAETAAQVRASALYFQNWQLAHDAVDYLQSTQPPTPVQHFWSLSVEEQFYLLWPLLFIAAGLATRRAKEKASEKVRRLVVLALTTALVLASLAYSAYETHANPAAAYFITPTRIWELGAGGLLALLPARLAERLGRQGWLGWTGLVMAVASAFVLRGTLAFPGVIALLPVGGAVLLIAGGSAAARYGPARLMSLKPLVFIGGISYSLYLWHWPVIVLWEAWRGQSPGVLAGLGLVLASVLLSWLTKVAVEDPVRQARLLSGHRWRSVSTALAAVLPVALVVGYLGTRPPPWNGHLGPGYPGAAALARSMSPVKPQPVVPPLNGAPPLTMAPLYWRQGCLDGVNSAVPKACSYGDTVNPTRKVVLIGDSIAGNWFPALNVIAQQQHWELITEVHGQCVWTATLQWYGGTNGPYTACQQWGAAVLHQLVTTIHPDLVITSGREQVVSAAHPKYGSAARADVGAGIATYWTQLENAGIPVVAIKETPELHGDVPDCVASHPTDYSVCGEARSQSIVADPPSSYAEAKVQGKVPMIDMNSDICGPQTCEPVVGNVLVYLDYHHMTSAFGQTLAPFLAPKLLAASPTLRQS